MKKVYNKCKTYSNELSHRTVTKQGRIEKVQVLKGIVEATQELLINSNYQNALNTSIKMMGKITRLNEINLYQILPNENIKQIGSSSNHLKEFHIEGSILDLKLETLNKGEMIFEKSLLTIPILVHDKLWGFITFKEITEGSVLSHEHFSLLRLFVSSVSHAIERKNNEEEKEYLSYHDSLTGLYNRRYLEKEFVRLNTLEFLPVSIIVADVNGLKLVNDAFGHMRGDRILIEASEIFKKVCRTQDVIIRWGGDEFIILLPNTDRLEAEDVVKNITLLCSNTLIHSLGISISLAFDTKDSMNEDIMKVLKNAENLMYKQKLVESAIIRNKTIQAIMQTLYEKNERENLHSKRVSELCVKLGIALSLSEVDINKLKTIGLLHDIGKIAIDESILNKPTKLNDKEKAEMRRHCEIGYRILSSSNELSELADYILSHHEKLNGTGYPNGLKGDEIHLFTRILSVSDAFDAMTRTRPYRNPLTDEEAILELVKYSCTQFDAHIVKIFVEKVLKKPWYKVMYGVTNNVILKNQYFDPFEGVTVIDNTDPVLSVNDIEILGSVDTSKNGVYPLIYTIINSNGRMERIERIITVGEMLPTKKIEYETSLKWDKIENDGAIFHLRQNRNELCIDIIKSGQSVWSSQIVYNNILLEKNKTYVLSFDAFSLIPVDVIASIGWVDVENDYYWTSFLGSVNNKFELTTKKQNYKMIFKMEKDSFDKTEVKFEFGHISVNQLFFDHIKIYEITV